MSTSTGLSGIGSGISDIFSGIGSFEASKGYFDAARIERENAQLAKVSGLIQGTRQERLAYQSFGSTTAAFGASGVHSDSGSALSVLNMAHRDASLDSELIKLQTAINVNDYTAKAGEYSAEGQAAQAQGAGGIFGGILGIAAAAFAF